jgi:hypothetical protein
MAVDGPSPMAGRVCCTYSARLPRLATSRLAWKLLAHDLQPAGDDRRLGIAESLAKALVEHPRAVNRLLAGRASRFRQRHKRGPPCRWSITFPANTPTSCPGDRSNDASVMANFRTVMGILRLLVGVWLG